MMLLDQYDVIAKEHKLAPMTACGCEMEIREHKDAETAWQVLVSATPEAGWFQCQSEQRSFTGGLPDYLPEWGVLLAAEAVTEGGGSLRIEHQNGAWKEIHYGHRDNGDFLCDEVTQYLHNGGQLNYRRYWRQDPEQGCIQTHACLIAVEQNTKED